MKTLKPAAGRLLIAEPFLGDPNFERSVILVCEHNEEGTFGLVLNQTTDSNLKEVWQETPYCEFPIYIGGPVQQNTLHFIHRLGDLIENSLEIGENLFWSGNYDQVIGLLNLGKITEKEIRFFAGYSGWGSGQLAREMTQNSWIVSEVESQMLFEMTASKLWREVLKKMGGEYKAKANYPIDPRLN